MNIGSTLIEKIIGKNPLKNGNILSFDLITLRNLMVYAHIWVITTVSLVNNFLLPETYHPVCPQQRSPMKQKTPD